MKLSNWILTQTDRKDPVGDLARDAKTDDKWPKEAGVKALREYLVGTAAEETLEEAHIQHQRRN